MRRRWIRAAALLVLAAACTAAPVMLPVETAPPKPDPCPSRSVRKQVVEEPFVAEPRVLGRSWIPATDSDRIRWFDPVTLRRTDAHQAALPEQTSVWAVSPDGGLVAIEVRGSVRVIDTSTLRTVVSLRRGGGSYTMAWISEQELVTVTDSEVLSWHRGTWSLRRADLSGSILAQVASPDRLLLVAGPDGRGPMGPTHLVDIGRSGVRSIPLDRIVTFDGDRGEVGVQLTPGLAYDPTGQRAFVVPPEGPVAEVDLFDGTVRYQSTPASFIRTIATSMLPAAEAKMGEWERVRAVWLGDDLLAVSGETGGTFDLDVSAAGVSLLDTRTWTPCLLDPRPTHVAVSDGVLVTWGGAEFGELGGTGLVGYDLRDGGRWHRFGRQYLDLQFYGGYAYAINSWDGWRVRTVDLETGEVLARYRGRPPTVLPAGMSTQGW